MLKSPIRVSVLMTPGLHKQARAYAQNTGVSLAWLLTEAIAERFGGSSGIPRHPGKGRGRKPALNRTGIVKAGIKLNPSTHLALVTTATRERKSASQFICELVAEYLKSNLAA